METHKINHNSIKNFCNFYVVARILEVLAHNGSMKRTNVQMLSRTNYKRFTRYLGWMLQSGIIEVQDGSDGMVLTISEKGKNVYGKLSSSIEELNVTA